ncbi:MlaD family protein [Nonomuraea dietziae]|uniref:MlaD family protein n=1 Tax=Nonomuraea dietziae TaxID=65515 RepID=UPI0033FA8AD6
MTNTLGAGLKLTLFALLTTACAAMLALMISGAAVAPAQVYRGLFTDATGLRPGDDVRVAGVRVGRVEEISLYGTQAEVAFSVRRSTPLPRGVVAAIRWRNLAGRRYLALTPGSDATGYLKPGERVATTRPALDVTALSHGFRPLLKAIRPEDGHTLSRQIVQVLQGEEGTVESLLGHISSVTGPLADREEVIGSVVDNLTVVLADIAGRDDAYGSLIGNLHALVKGLSAESEAIGDSPRTPEHLAGAAGPREVRR